MMAIKIIDSKGFHRYMDAIEDIDYKIEELEQKITTLREYLKDLYAKKEECVIHYLDTPTYSHSIEMIDKFIKDINFNGTWTDEYRCERYFYWDDKHGWDCYRTNLKVVYYKEVEMRYQDLKREGKL